MRYVFAGDRELSVKILRFLKEQGMHPLALLVSEGSNASHAQELIEVSELPEERVFYGKSFTDEKAMAILSELDVDYIIGIHFPYIIPKRVLDIPNIGFLNLHPSYLPYNKGWHTPSWAILSGDPYGATLHFMSEGLDEGDIIHQKEINIQPNDTANSLYARVLDLEFDVFTEAFESLKTLQPNNMKQTHMGTSYKKKDLFKIREIALEDATTWGNAIDTLRALTTNKIEEAVCFEKDGKKYAVQINITEIDS
ncbi:MAG: hypothetical protein KTR22_06485 [Flavobacteriaceae bacterium]|nr:hypothetical protein [Flavobacteriaceae bacterium]